MTTPAIAPNPKYFAVHGGSEVGGKYGQLILKLDAYLGAGFGRQKAHVLSMEFVSEYLKRCGAEREIAAGNFEGARQRILQGKFTSAEFKEIEAISRDLSQFPALAVRNSAYGDAVGSGMLGDSKFSLNRAGAIALFAKAVIASYYTADSAAFRKDACLAEGIAVGIEPMVANEFQFKLSIRIGEYEYKEQDAIAYCPTLSGIGRTDSLHSGPFLGAVGGLALEYVKDPNSGIIISRDTEYQHLHDICRYSQYGCESLKDGWIYALASNGKIINAKIDVVDVDVLELVPSEPLGMLKRLQESCGCEQRIEWAMRMEGMRKTPVYNIVQISDSPESKFTFKDEEAGNAVLGKGEARVGAGRKESDFLVRILEGGGWHSLRSINSEYPSYILASHSFEQNNMSFASYSDMNRALAICDCAKNRRGLTGFDKHFGGTLAMTDKLAVQIYDVDWALVERHAKSVKYFNGLESNGFSRAREVKNATVVYELPVGLLSSERQGKCALFLNEKGDNA